MKTLYLLYWKDAQYNEYEISNIKYKLSNSNNQINKAISIIFVQGCILALG